MALAVALRSDFTAARMRALARLSRDASQVRRLLALAAIYEGGTRSDAAQLGGVGLQTVRDWVLRFNAAGPDGLIDVVPPGGGHCLMTRNAGPWRRSSRAARSRPRTVSCAGA